MAHYKRSSPFSTIILPPSISNYPRTFELPRSRLIPGHLMRRMKATTSLLKPKLVHTEEINLSMLGKPRLIPAERLGTIKRGRTVVRMTTRRLKEDAEAATKNESDQAHSEPTADQDSSPPANIEDTGQEGTEEEPPHVEVTLPLLSRKKSSRHSNNRASFTVRLAKAVERKLSVVEAGLEPSLLDEVVAEEAEEPEPDFWSGRASTYNPPRRVLAEAFIEEEEEEEEAVNETIKEEEEEEVEVVKVKLKMPPPPIDLKPPLGFKEEDSITVKGIDKAVEEASAQEPQVTESSIQKEVKDIEEMQIVKHKLEEVAEELKTSNEPEIKPSTEHCAPSSDDLQDFWAGRSSYKPNKRFFKEPKKSEVGPQKLIDFEQAKSFNCVKEIDEVKLPQPEETLTQAIAEAQEAIAQTKEAVEEEIDIWAGRTSTYNPPRRRIQPFRHFHEPEVDLRLERVSTVQTPQVESQPDPDLAKEEVEVEQILRTVENEIEEIRTAGRHEHEEILTTEGAEDEEFDLWSGRASTYNPPRHWMTSSDLCSMDFSQDLSNEIMTEESTQIKATTKMEPVPVTKSLRRTNRKKSRFLHVSMKTMSYEYPYWQEEKPKPKAVEEKIKIETSSSLDSNSSNKDSGKPSQLTKAVEEKTKVETSASFDSNSSNKDSGVSMENEEKCDVCHTNCHAKCELFMPNLCGVNQKLLAEALAELKMTPAAASEEIPEATGAIASSTQSTFRSLSSKTASLSLDSSESTDDEDEEYVPSTDKKPSYRVYHAHDFQFLRVLGKGSFGKVLLAELKNTSTYYAIKCLKKDVVLEDDDVDCTMIERKVLLIGSKHPFLCHLLCTFQTESHLFFVMEYLNGGDLMFHIQHSGRFSEDRARFYSAEIYSGLAFLHRKGVIYRDLKLDNILLDFEGHVRIADFGMCKLQMFLEKTADTFCGTPDYMAPEIIRGMRYTNSVDFWAFGVLIYEMLVGQSPFSGSNEDELFWSVCNEVPSWPRFLSREAKRLLEGLLEKDAHRRLGSPGYSAAIKDHMFYLAIDWDALERRELQPPFRPKLKTPLDLKYFDPSFTREPAKLSAIDPIVLKSMDQSQFDGFSYTNPHATDD